MNRNQPMLPSKLVENLRNSELTMFIGAGLSINAGLPSWSSLVRPWAESVNARWPQDEADLTAQHMLAVVQHYENQFGRNTLIRSLRESLSHPDKQPTRIHELLATWPLKTIFTTNYDSLIEQAFLSTDRQVDAIVAETDLAFWSDNQIQLVKLCGDLNQPQSIVITQSDFSTYASTHPRLTERLRTILESSTGLFLGYSLQDPFFNQIWDNIGLDFVNLRRRSYAVLYDADPLAIDDLKRRGIEVINLQTNGSNHGELLEEWLAALTSQIASGYTQDPENKTTSATDTLKAQVDPRLSQEITGQQLQELQEALLSAYPSYPDLARIVRFGLDVNLSTITHGLNLTDDVFKLISWAEAQNKISELLQAATEHNTGNLKLQHYLKKYG